MLVKLTNRRKAQLQRSICQMAFAAHCRLTVARAKSCENRLLMYSSNHLVRDCSILNLHIIITQSLLPNQSKHMDMFLRELRVYYAGRLVRT